jgi:ribosomal protein L6P/L9E
MMSFINYSDFKNLMVERLNNKVYFSISEKSIAKFVSLPENVLYQFHNKFVQLEAKDELAVSALLVFLKDLENLKKSVDETNFKRKLRLKGLGFRISVDMPNRELTFKLGYSHMIKVVIPDYVTNIRTTKKNLMLIESFDKISLGDFVKYISYLRKADSYKGKGFSGQYEKKKLKVIKKK